MICVHKLPFLLIYKILLPIVKFRQQNDDKNYIKQASYNILIRIINMTAKQFKEKQLNEIKFLLNKEKSKLVQAALRNDLRMLEAEIKIIEGCSYEKAYGIEE